MGRPFNWKGHKLKMVSVKEAKVKVTAGVILAVFVLCSCNQPKPHHQPVAVTPQQPVAAPAIPKSATTKAKPRPAPQAKSITGKHVIEPDRKIKRPHRIELPSVKVAPAHTPSFEAPPSEPEPKTVEVELPKVEPVPKVDDPPKKIDPVVVPSEEEIQELPKIEKVEPLIQRQPETEPNSNSKKDEVLVDANNATRIIDAQGRSVIVVGSDGLILISGGTEQLVVKGDSNQIQCDSATDLMLSGNNNNIVFDKFGGGEVTGDSNNVSWDKGLIGGFNPIVSNTGSKNEIGAN